jgi:hypothetical protein
MTLLNYKEYNILWMPSEKLLNKLEQEDEEEKLRGESDE